MIYKALLLIFWKLFISKISITDGLLPQGAHRVESCPKPNNLSDWKRASRLLNCTEYSPENIQNKFLYHCLPSIYLNETIEFCGATAAIEKGSCPIYNYASGATVATSQKCSNFTKGCPDPEYSPYHSLSFYQYPACWDINKLHRCYNAEPECARNKAPPHADETQNQEKPKVTSATESEINVPLLIVLTSGITVTLLVFAIIGFAILFKKYVINQTSENHTSPEQEPLKKKHDMQESSQLEDGYKVKQIYQEDSTTARIVKSDTIYEMGKYTALEHELYSPSLRNLFDFERIIVEDNPSYVSFSRSILTAIQFDEFLNKVRQLSRHVELKRDIPSNSRDIEPGTIFAFEVDVVHTENEVKIIERAGEPLRDRFFYKDLPDAVKVILIHSNFINDGKWHVYKAYEPLLSSTHILLQHVTEEFDKISKQSGQRTLDYLSKVLTDIKKKIPVDRLRDILQTAADKALSMENIQKLCDGVDLQNEEQTGTIESPSHICLVDIERKLMKRTLEECLKSVEQIFWENILQCVTSITKCKIEIPNHSELTISKILRGHVGSILASLKDKTNLTNVDINSKEWRGQVAIHVYGHICPIKQIMLNESLPIITCMCERTKNDLKAISKQMNEFRFRIALPNQHSLARNWREETLSKPSMS